MYLDHELRRFVTFSSAPYESSPKRASYNDRLCRPHQAPIVLGVTQELSRMADQWYFAGLNAHRILDLSNDPDEPSEDLRRFTPLNFSSDTDGDVDILFACWSQLVFRAGDRLIIRGFRAGEIENVAASTIVSIVGDHNGIMGALDRDGRLYLTEQSGDAMSTPRLVLVTQEDGPRLAKVSVAGNFRVAITFKQAPASSMIHVEEFRDLGHFCAWYKAPAEEANRPVKHHMLQGRTKQLISNQNIFILLTEAGQVYTWGDPRYRGLGRLTQGLDHTRADKPGLVDGLSEDKIIKVSGGGRMFAALAEDKNVYIWSGSLLGNNAGLSMHEGLPPGSLAGLIIEDDHGQPRQFDDVGVGNGHILVRTTDGKVFAAGENGHGQLALDSSQGYYEDWIEVVSGGCSFIRAGAKTSVIKANQEHVS